MKYNKLVTKIGKCLCSLAVLMAPVTTMSCRLFLHQPEEPEGLEGFVLKHKAK